MAKQIKKYSKIALIVGLSIALTAMHLITPSAEAYGDLTDRELRISDSRLGATNVYYDFLADDAGGNIKCVQIKFCDESDIDTGTCTQPNNMDTQNASTTATTTVFDWNNMEATNWTLYSTTTNTLVASTTVAAGEDWGDNGSLVIGGITNSNATQTYFAWIQTYSDSDCSSLSTEVDRGVVAFAILSGVTVTATVAESLSVTVNASTCESLITGGLNATSTTTTIPFGTVITEDFYNSCQRLDIGTNGASGYIARIHKTQQLTSAGSDVIDDGDCDGGGSPCGTSTEATWSTDTNNGFAYCMKDEGTNAAATADNGWATLYCGSGSQSFKTISNGASSSEIIMQFSSATSSNNAWIGYRLSVDAAQPAGTYTTEIVYTVTPKY